MYIGLYFGSFNPIHNGHLAIAEYMYQNYPFDAICFVVSPSNPLKNNVIFLSEHKRLELLQIAIEDKEYFFVSDIEFLLSKPSFTFQTLSVLSEQEPDTQFILVIGGDNVDLFHQWKNYEWIMENYPIFVYPRLGSSNQIPGNYSNMTLINAPVIEISSTFIRQSIRAGKDIRFFLPEAAYKMIIDGRLYY